MHLYFGLNLYLDLVNSKARRRRRVCRPGDLTPVSGVVSVFVYLCICVFVHLCICVFVYLCICVFVYL